MKTNLTKFLVVCALVIAAPHLRAEHSWGGYHWARTANPMPLQVIDSVSADWQYEFDTALAEWNVASPLTMSVVSANDSARARKQCRMAAGMMRVCNAAYGFNGWLGLATIGLDSNGHIDQGTAKVNDSYAGYWDDPNQKRHVMCQEVGHVFGLGHTSEDGSIQFTCMDYSTDPNSVAPNGHDYALLDQIYLHLDSYNSYAVVEGGGKPECRGKKCNANAQMPPMGVRVHRGKHHEIWIAGREDGGLWIHHIRLAPGHSPDHAH